MSAPTLERADAAALPEVVALMRRAFDPRFGEAWTIGQAAGVMAMPGAALVLARHRRRLLGFALSRTLVGECELMLLAVDPEARRLGTGRRLVDRVVADARAEGAERIFLEMRRGNPAAALYQAVGFACVGTRPQYYRGNMGETFDAATYSFIL